jgi:hypothetical protein
LQEGVSLTVTFVAFFFIAMAVMCFIYLICSLRTNMVFFMIFFTLVCAFCLLAGSFWQANNGDMVLSHRLQVAAGAFAFCTCIFGWWIFIAIMLASLDFPFEVPGEWHEWTREVLTDKVQWVICRGLSRAQASGMGAMCSRRRPTLHRWVCLSLVMDIEMRWVDVGEKNTDWEA